MPGTDPATFKQRMALTNMHNALGWSTVVIYLLFAAGFGCFCFAQPEAPGRTGEVV